MSDSVAISVVLPCYNEVGNIDPLIGELRAALDATGRTYEILYVDDNSNDGSFEKLTELSQSLPFLRVIRHRTNFGESGAMLTGFAHARGELVFTMDADLQNDPADIPLFLAEMDAGADCATGVRKKRLDSFSKRMSSKIANAVRAVLVGDSILDAGCTYRVMRREALRELVGFKALHRFLPTILEWRGLKVTQLTINHRPRTSGVSKYGIGNRLWVGISDMFGMRWYRKRMLLPNRMAPVVQD